MAKRRVTRRPRAGGGRGFGLRDGSMRGWKAGGRGRNRTSTCRHPSIRKRRKK